MATGDSRLRGYLEQIQIVTEEAKDTLGLFLGEGSRTKEQHGSLPSAYRSLLTESIVVEAVGDGRWGISGRYWDCKKRDGVRMEISLEGSSLSEGSTRRALWEAALWYFLRATCPICCYERRNVEELNIRLRMVSREDNVEIKED